MKTIARIKSTLMHWLRRVAATADPSRRETGSPAAARQARARRQATAPTRSQPDVAENAGKPLTHAVRVVRRVASDRWAWSELLRDADPHFHQRVFHPRTHQRSADVVQAFGTATPHSGDFLLHYAGDAPGHAPHRPWPVILVHGANCDGDFFADPRRDGSVPGLAGALRAEGFAVYAVTFAHNQDDNYVWAQQLTNAIERVRTLTGASHVDLVAHSKGGVPTRMVVSDFRKSWMTPYRGDVRRAVFVASPFGGVDYLFRHPVANLALFRESTDHRLNAPMSWDNILWFGTVRDARELGCGSEAPDFWPGQRQLLARWDDVYPPARLEQDWHATYHGGDGLISASRGIDHFIADSQDFMPRLQEARIDPEVEIAVLAGNRANLPGMLNEYTGVSDGLLFVDSALQIPPGTRVVAEAVMPLNHLQLAMDPQAHQWVAAVLAQHRPQPMSPHALDDVRRSGLQGPGVVVPDVSTVARVLHQIAAR